MKTLVAILVLSVAAFVVAQEPIQHGDFDKPHWPVHLRIKNTVTGSTSYVRADRLGNATFAADKAIIDTTDGPLTLTDADDIAGAKGWFEFWLDPFYADVTNPPTVDTEAADLLALQKLKVWAVLPVLGGTQWRVVSAGATVGVVSETPLAALRSAKAATEVKP